MRRKIWSDRDVQTPEREPAATRNPSPSTDRMKELLAMIDGGEGGGGTPCSLGVPPWFLAAAHGRLAEITGGTEHADKVEAVFGDGPGSAAIVAPDKVALLLAAIDETFRAEVRAVGGPQG